MKEKFYGLDHLRTLAIVSVVLFHYPKLSNSKPDWLVNASQFGWTGVDLFFVLSGFLISSQLFKQINENNRFSFKQFFLKRIFRILPAYFTIVAIYFSVPFFREKESLPPLWKFLTFTQNFGLNKTNFGTFSHAWSLCVEEYFYLLFPLLLIFLLSVKLFRKSYFLLIALLLFGFAVRYYCYTYLYLPEINSKEYEMIWHKYIYYPTYTRLDCLLAGVSIAALYVFMPNFWNKISKYGNSFFMLSLIILTLSFFISKDRTSFNATIWGFPLIALGFGLMVISAISPTSFLFKWRSKTTTFIAMLSYAIYLSHKGLIHITNDLLSGFNLNGNLILIVSLIASTIGAILLNKIVEKPFLNLRNRFID
jgi:peptidoglycan/LPS O-acetylase OafA/YrhL